MPSSRRYFDEVWRVLERDRRIASIALLEMEIWPDDPEQWSQSTLDFGKGGQRPRPNPSVKTWA